eukprot:TRINITY_DN10686_c0_g1_i1.p1 TRINITY_DN10686_c0_g1~~TRINITY_DN10686_c0_g1_i1.p1  ORF type:complete len:189 (+),score=26.95 TRINITY_DN10686_c0_g1_i1:122-688(+)
MLQLGASLRNAMLMARAFKTLKSRANQRRCRFASRCAAANMRRAGKTGARYLRLAIVLRRVRKRRPPSALARMQRRRRRAPASALYASRAARRASHEQSELDEGRCTRPSARQAWRQDGAASSGTDNAAATAQWQDGQRRMVEDAGRQRRPLRRVATPAPQQRAQPRSAAALRTRALPLRATAVVARL